MKSWRTQPVSNPGTNKEQKGSVKDGSSCGGLLTPLESTDM